MLGESQEGIQVAIKNKAGAQDTDVLMSRAPSVDLGDDLPLQFEEALTELERLVVTMESGNLSLDESILAYQRGVKLAKVCQDRLNAAQLQVSVLEQDLLRPFEAVNESLGDEDE